jgi:hypothetical protein
MAKFDEDFYKMIFNDTSFKLNFLCKQNIIRGKERGLSPTDTAVLITKAAREIAFAIAEDIEALDSVDEEEE